MSIRVKCNGIYLGNINFTVYHNALIGSYIHYLSNNATTVFIILILNKFTF